jgi:hypothetical protein
VIGAPMVFGASAMIGAPMVFGASAMIRPFV